jgi:NADH oxidase (H2O-forming)
MSSFEIKDGLYWVGAQDFDLRVFDVIMQTEHGTSYNSYLLKTPQYKVLFETVKDKFFDTFIRNLKEICDPSELNYIVIDHTEPDHSGSLRKLLELAPNAEVLASATALEFLRDICNCDIPGSAVVDNQELQLDTCTLKFMSVPFLHWPDSIYTWIPELQTLMSCDSFGCHYASNEICNDLIEGNFEPAYQYYYNNIMGPFKPYMRYALDRVGELPVKTICPGHGPVLRDNLDYYLGLYAKWSAEPEPEPRGKPLVSIPYVSAYGYTEALASEIAAGIKESQDCDVYLHDMVHADAAKVFAEMAVADGIVAGSPTVNGDALPPVFDLLMQLNGVLHGGKVGGAFGSYGWSGEAAEMLSARMKVLRMDTVEPPLKIKFNPHAPEKVAAARDFGNQFGRKLKDAWELKKNPNTGKLYWKCTVCGEVFEGALPPVTCPVCGAGREAFIEYVPEDVTYRDERQLKLVIVGGGVAAVAAAKAARERNPNAQIDIYSAEKDLPYHRPNLTKAISEGTSARDFLIYKQHVYDALKINIHTGVKISAIDKATRTITIEDGEPVQWDKLLLAVGATSFVPPIPGAQLPEVVVLRDSADLERIRDLMSRQKIENVAVIGGGLLGLEAADAMARLSAAVTVVEACPYVLPRQIDSEGAPLLNALIEKSGRIKCIYGAFVEHILGDSRVTGIKLSNKDEIKCSLVVISAGIRCATELASAANLEIEHGIVTDLHMQTSAADIYAAGDCCVCDGHYYGIWEPALEQGRVAGANMVGDMQKFKPTTFGATLHAFDLDLFSVGNIDPDKIENYRATVIRDETTGRFHKVIFDGDTMCGGILLNEMKTINQLVSGVNQQWSQEKARESGLLP